MPAKAVAHWSVDWAYASVVTESSSFDSSISTTSKSSFFLDALRRVCKAGCQRSFWVQQGVSYNLIGNATSPLAAPSAYEQETLVSRVKVAGIKGVAQGDLCTGWWGSHDRVLRIRSSPEERVFAEKLGGSD